MGTQLILRKNVILESCCLFRVLPILAILCLTAQGALAFEGAGLFKNGKGLGDFDADPDQVTETSQDAVDTTDQASVIKHELSQKARARRFTTQKKYIKTVLGIKDLVRAVKKKEKAGLSLDEDLALLIEKGRNLAKADLEVVARFDEIEKKCRKKGYSRKILDRHAKMVKKHKEGVRNLTRLLNSLSNQKDKTKLSKTIEALHEFFSDRKFKEDPPLVGPKTLPVNMTNIEAPLINAESADGGATLVPPLMLETLQYGEGGQGGGMMLLNTPPTQGDLDPNVDVQFTEEIIDLANSLDNSPVKIYEYVKNECEFEPYVGSRKGSQETLAQRGGNDYDLASLLIALLRVSNIPARYGTGIVEIPVEEAKNWLGVEDGATAGNILTTAGMEGVNVVFGSEVIAVRCRRVWVETYIPYTNYRGIGNDDTGEMWVPMDAAFKQYEYQPGIDIPQEMGFDAEAFVDDYISTFHEESPVELYQQQIIDYLAVNHPDLSYEDILRTRELQPERMGILPGTFPHKLLSRDDEYSEIPSEKRYQIRFHVYDSGASLDYTANLPEIAGKQVTISYVAATSDDQQIIDDAGGLFEVENPWLVHLKPVLRIDGCEVATGSGEVLMGLTQKSDMYFMPPEGAQNRIPYVSNTILAGTYQGVGLDTWRVAPTLSFSPSTTCEESYAAYLLHDTALMYLGRLDAANEEVSETMQMVLTNDVAETIVEHVIEVTYNGYGIPLTFEWAGVRIDADRDIVASFSVTGDSESKEFMRLTGADSSIMENRVFEDGYDAEAISAVKVLELANDMGIPVYEIDSSNVSTILPMLTVSSSVKDYVSNAVSIGHVVIIPRDNITYYDWTGIGFVDMDPVTCAAANIISGGSSGGQTVEELVWTWKTNDCISAEITYMEPTVPDTPDPYDISQITHIYLPENESSLLFVATITPYHWPSSGHPCWAQPSYDRYFNTSTRPAPNSIDGLAEKYGLGEYQFLVGTQQADCSQCGITSQNFWIGVEVTEFTVSDNQHGISKTSPGDSEIYVPENIPEGADSGYATITIQDVRIYPETDRGEIWSRVLWKVTGDGVGSPSSGSFGPGLPPATLTLTPTENNRQYKVEVGFDADNNGELDVNEVSKDENEDPLAITVYVVKADLEINGQRRWTPKFGQCNKL